MPSTNKPLKCFQIHSLTGMSHGIWLAKTPVEALAKMHQEADVDCIVTDEGGLLFKDPEMYEICGNVDDWNIHQIARPKNLYI
jgi:hypothetical protein